MNFRWRFMDKDTSDYPYIDSIKLNNLGDVEIATNEHVYLVNIWNIDRPARRVIQDIIDNFNLKHRDKELYLMEMSDVLPGWV